VSKENLDWAITFRTPIHQLRFIEVKGRAGAQAVTITRDEIFTGFHKPDHWMRALVALG
jgi:hypothetical protein